MDIYDRLEVIRDDLDLSLSEMSKRLGYAHNEMYRLLHRQINITPSFIETFCKTFGVNEAYLHNGKGKKFTAEPQLYRKNNIRKRLKELRGEEDLKAYSEKTGIFVANYKKIESGETKLTLKSATRIAGANNVSVDWLMYGDEKAKNDPVDEEMITWLKAHPETRHKIKKLIEKERK